MKTTGRRFGRRGGFDVWVFFRTFGIFEPSLICFSLTLNGDVQRSFDLAHVVGKRGRFQGFRGYVHLAASTC